MQQWKLDHPTATRMLYCLVALLVLVSCLFGGYVVLIRHVFSVLAILAALPAVVLCGVLLLIKPPRSATSHGSAHWATLAELRRALLVPPPERLMLTAPGSAPTTSQAAPESLLLVGFRGRYPVALTERQQESHVLIVAPTGKRKSSGFFIPALLGERGHRTLVINDLKGELFALTAGAVSRYHKVVYFSPTHPGRSNGYNPLAHIKTSKQARDFAVSWVANTGISREAFWNRASEVLIASVVLHLVDTEPGASLGRLADLLSSNTLESMKKLLTNSASERARKTAGVFLETLEANLAVASGIMLGVSNRFSFLIDSQDYRAVTSHDDLDFDALVDGPKPTALYIQVPASAVEDLKPITSLLIMQLMNFLARRAEQEPGGRLPRPVALYLDEFANMGRVPDIEKHITLIRGAGMATIAAVQDFGQLQRVYGEEIADTLLSNFTTQITLPGVGQAEAEYYSRRLGVTTVLSRSVGVSRSGGGLLGASNITTSTTESEATRPLLLPEELRTMPVGSFILITDNAPPVRGQFRTYIERPELQPLLNVKVRRRRVVRVVQEPQEPQPIIARSSPALPAPEAL